MTFYIAGSGFKLDKGCVILLQPADINPAFPWNSVQDEVVLTSIFAKHQKMRCCIEHVIFSFISQQLQISFSKTIEIST